MIRSRTEYLERWSELHGHSQPRGVVRGWLWFAFHLARPLARLGVSPHIISLFGVVAAIAAVDLSGRSPAIAASVIVLSLVFDGLDGAVAVLRHRESAWGAVIDAVVDRVAEAMWAVTLVIVGVPVWMALVGWTLAMVQEYARARQIALTDAERPVVVSVCERPVRALLIAAAILMSASVPVADLITPTVVTGIWLMLQSVGLAQVWLAARQLSR